MPKTIRKNKALLVLLVFFFIILSILVHKVWKNYDADQKILSEYFFIQENNEYKFSIVHPDNIRLEWKKYKLIKFSYQDQPDFKDYGFLPISLCHVRGLPLRSPLFEDKIKKKDINAYSYFWKQTSKNWPPKSNEKNFKQILIAINSSYQEGWLLSTPWLTKEWEVKSVEDLLEWQKDSFHKLRGCEDMGI